MTGTDSPASWQIWYQDLFDRETARQVEKEGRGLVEGLSQLWQRYLSEGCLADGQASFARFNLWWEQAQTSIEIHGEREGLRRLRMWFGDEPDAGAEELLHNIAVAHCFLLLRGQTGQEIAALAAACSSRQEFEARLVVVGAQADKS
jgi:hypothetical protein